MRCEEAVDAYFLKKMEEQQVERPCDCKTTKKQTKRPKSGGQKITTAEFVEEMTAYEREKENVVQPRLLPINKAPGPLPAASQPHGQSVQSPSSASPMMKTMRSWKLRTPRRAACVDCFVPLTSTSARI